MYTDKTEMRLEPLFPLRFGNVPELELLGSVLYVANIFRFQF